MRFSSLELRGENGQMRIVVEQGSSGACKDRLGLGGQGSCTEYGAQTLFPVLGVACITPDTPIPKQFTF